MSNYNTIAESNHFIILDNYTKYSETNDPPGDYQTEAAMEQEFVQDLQNRGYEYVPGVTTPMTILANARVQ